MKDLIKLNDLFIKKAFKKITKVEFEKPDKNDLIDIKQSCRNKKTVSF
jgi:hypothetical protein